MRMYPHMFETLNKENNQKNSHHRLSLIQKIKIAIIDLKIFIAMKLGEDEILVADLDAPLISEFQNRGFSVKIRYLGCSSFLSDFYMFVISWKKSAQ